MQELSPGAGAQPARLRRLMVSLVLLGVLAGPAASALGEWVDEGGAPASAFGLLLFVLGLVLAVLGRDVEHLVFSTCWRPLLGGRLRRWQRLILPFGTDTLVTRGMSGVMAGATVLLTSDPGWSALNIVALGFAIAGGALLGLALSRLLAGLLVLHWAGLWGAPRRSWLLGASLVFLGTIGGSIHSAVVVFQIAPAI